MVRVKVCGLTCLEDARAAAEAGADALGFVLAPSPRRITPEQVREIVRRLPPLVLTVGVFVDEPMVRVSEIRRFCGLDAVQLHGRESEVQVKALGGRVIKALRVGDRPMKCQALYPTATLLLDTFVPDRPGGTGRVFDWNLALEPARERPIILAGGLRPDNVAEAIRFVKPYAVDVSSGVEHQPGRKDHDQMADFIRQAKTVGPVA